MSNGVKMMMISYNSAINTEVMETLEKCGIENYTRWTQVQGKGKASGPHMASEIWPGENSVLFIAEKEEKMKKLIVYIKELRKRLGKEGIKAFTWNLEEIT